MYVDSIRGMDTGDSIGMDIGDSIGTISDSLTHHCISIQPVGLYSWIFIQPGDLYSTG